LFKVAKLVDNYLAEIAPDANLKLAKFMVIAEALPTHARTVHDGLYRAIDIYLKVCITHLCFQFYLDKKFCDMKQTDCGEGFHCILQILDLDS
jgi:hypothetical protein